MFNLMFYGIIITLYKTIVIFNNLFNLCIILIKHFLLRE